MNDALTAAEAAPAPPSGLRALIASFGAEAAAPITELPSFDQLTGAGFGYDLLPIGPRGAPINKQWGNLNSARAGKIPMRYYPKTRDWSGFGEWSDHVFTADEYSRMDKWPLSAKGVRARQFPAIDADLTEGNFSARLLLRLRKELGWTPCRTRSDAPARFLLGYRLAPGETPFAKTDITFMLPYTGRQKIEFLADGQQYVAWGQHPDGALYQWDYDPALMGAETMREVTAGEWQHAMEIIRQMIADEGGRVIDDARLAATGEGDKKPIGEGDVAEDQGALAEALNSIPNDTGRQPWLIRTIAFKGAGGDEVEWLKWCATWTGGADDPEDNRTVWSSITETSIGATALFAIARAYSPLDAAEMFPDDLPPLAAKPPATASSAGKVPQVRSFDWYREQDFPAEEWLVEGLIPLGSVVFAMGRPKVGKGLLAMQLGLSVAAGVKFLSAYQCTQSEVLHITFEEDDRMIHERIASLADRSSGLPVNFATEWPRIGKGGIEALDAYADNHPKCRFYVIDPFAVIRETQRAGSVYDLDYAAIRPLFEWAKRRKVTVFIVHHTRKAASPDDWQDGANGSTGLIGAVDGTLLLTGKRNGTSGRLQITGRFKMHIDDIPLTKDSDGRWFATSSTETRRATVRESVFEALRAGCSTPVEIAERIGRKANHVNNELAKMRADGAIMQLGHGRWGLPRTVEDLFT